MIPQVVSVSFLCRAGDRDLMHRGNRGGSGPSPSRSSHHLVSKSALVSTRSIVMTHVLLISKVKQSPN